MLKGFRLTLLQAFCIFTLQPGAAVAQDNSVAAEAFDQEYYTTVIELLESNTGTAQSRRMLALSYFHLDEFEKALPLLNQSLAANRNDTEVVSALVEIEVANRNYDRANDLAKSLSANFAKFTEARIQLDQPEGNRTAAKEDLQQLIETGDLELALRAADTLIEAYLYDGQIESAHLVAELAMSKHPTGENSVRYAPFLRAGQEESSILYNVGYRFEYDDNVTFPEENLASGEADYRHVLLVDVNYQKPLKGNWELYALGNLYQSFHHNLDQFNRTKVVASAALGQNYRRTGWRMPLEITHERLDGDFYRTSLAAIPGFYIKFGENLFSHFYTRIQSDNYFEPLFANDDRSGNVLGAGILVTGQISRRFNLRSYVEFNRYDTDGAYWDRKEFTVFAQGEFEFIDRWTAGLAFRFVDEDYDNARPVFGNRQKDRSHELYLNITHRFLGDWRWRGQISLINHESNIALFDYDRNVYSFAVTREF